MAKRDRSLDRTDRLAELPAFDLSWVFDDEEDPARVTVFAETGNAITGQWLSIGIDHAVDLDEIA